MKRYYGLDSDNELVKYIKYVKRNHIVNLMKSMMCIFKMSTRNDESRIMISNLLDPFEITHTCQ